jgi:hypothetical protein
VAFHFSDTVSSIEINKVQGKLHEKSMNSLARNDPHPFAPFKALATQQSLCALRTIRRNLGARGYLGIPRHIENPHARILLYGVSGLLRLFFWICDLRWFHRSGSTPSLGQWSSNRKAICKKLLVARNDQKA